MRKPCLSALFWIAGAFGVSAQGLVLFYNDPYGFENSIENGGTECYLVCDAPGHPIDNPNYSAQLWENGFACGDPIRFYGTVWPGVWDITSDPLYGSRFLSVPGGTQTTLQVVIYNETRVELGRSWPFYYTPPTSPIPVPSEMLMNHFRSWSGCCVPEPSATALGVAGLAACLLFHRRRR